MIWGLGTERLDSRGFTLAVLAYLHRLMGGYHRQGQQHDFINDFVVP
jgi:hypothetical protein